jgi:hypothetical protein
MFGRILERDAGGVRPGAKTGHDVVRNDGGSYASARNAVLPDQLDRRLVFSLRSFLFEFCN